MITNRTVNMGKGYNLSVDLKNRIISLYKKGEKQCDISARLMISRCVVSRTIKNYNTRGIVVNLKRGGRNKKLKVMVENKIRAISSKDPFKSAPQISTELGNVGVSVRTIQRRLQQMGLSARRPAKKPLLSSKNIEARLSFAYSHANLTPTDWGKVLFSDESKFSLIKSDGIQYVRRPDGERLNPKFVCQTVKHGGGNIMVWGCFSMHGMGPIHRIEGIMDKVVYRNILQHVMLPYAEWNMPLRFIFQQDNDPKHTAKLVKQWFEINKINVLPWPAQSPDLNPIENLWEIVESKIRTKRFSNNNDLFLEVSNIWKNMDMDIIKNLIHSMSNRCRQVIKNNGYWTKY